MRRKLIWITLAILLTAGIVYGQSTLTKRLIGTQDISFATGGANQDEVFSYTTPQGYVLSLTKPDASHLKFRTSLLLKNGVHSVEDLYQGGYNAIRYGPGTLTLATIQAALAQIVTDSNPKTILRLVPGTWTITDNLTIPSNVTLLPEPGAILQIATTKTLTINGPFQANLNQVFSCTGTGQVVFGAGAVKEAYPEWWAVNTSPGTTDMTAAIQAATNSLTQGTVKFCGSQYGVSVAITPKNNVSYKSDCYSEIKFISATSFGIFTINGSTLENVTWDGLSFDGELNYPANSTIYKATYAISNIGIYLYNGVVDARTTSDFKNIKIKNCMFSNLSHSSVFITGLNLSNIVVEDCSFYKGSYIYSVICVRATSGCGTTQLAKGVRVINNSSDTNGPQYYYNPAVEDWISSCDGIKVTSSEAPVVIGNTVYKAGCEGIQVELCINPSITGNTVDEPGGDGIIVYNYADGATITGNTVTNWGRTPYAYGIRDYSGTNVVAREFPDAVKAALPADPTVVAWFDTWPYSNDNVNIASIIAYSNTDYYTGPSAGILPFRGYSGICVVHASQDFVVSGNKTSYVDTTGADGGYLYASDFGFSVVHPINQPIANSGKNGYVGANDFKGRRYNIFHPNPYYEPNHSLWGAMGQSTYANRPFTKSIVYSNRPAFQVNAVSGQNDNITAGAAYTVVWGTEIFDQGGNFATNTFTAPVTGLYQMEFTLDLRNVDSGATLYEAALVTSNRTYYFYFDPSKFSGDLTYYSVTYSALADMDAAETATITLTQTGGANQTDIEAYSRWSGFLVE